MPQKPHLSNAGSNGSVSINGASYKAAAYINAHHSNPNRDDYDPASVERVKALFNQMIELGVRFSVKIQSREAPYTEVCAFTLFTNADAVPEPLPQSTAPRAGEPQTADQILAGMK